LIAVTGATGHVGRLVAEDLARRGLPMRLLVHDPSRTPEIAGAEIAVADYGDPDSVARALEPGDRVFMVSMHQPPEPRLALHRSFIDATTKVGVGRIVYLSFIGAGPDASFVHARSHGATEAMLAQSGVPYAAVRNGMYADEIASWFDDDGRITGPGGDGRISLSYRPELGEAIAALLADRANDDRTIVTVTGEAVTLAELAETASRVTGDDYRYEPTPKEEWIAYRRSLGRPDWAIEAGSTYYDGVRKGEADVVGDDYRRLTGKAPITIAELIALYRERLPLSSRT
jgi:NAD(P)H dehydrogenase (quinone)